MGNPTYHDIGFISSTHPATYRDLVRTCSIPHQALPCLAALVVISVPGEGQVNPLKPPCRLHWVRLAYILATCSVTSVCQSQAITRRQDASILRQASQSNHHRSEKKHPHHPGHGFWDSSLHVLAHARPPVQRKWSVFCHVGISG